MKKLRLREELGLTHAVLSQNPFSEPVQGRCVPKMEHSIGKLLWFAETPVL